MAQMTERKKKKIRKPNNIKWKALEFSIIFPLFFVPLQPKIFDDEKYVLMWYWINLIIFYCSSIINF